MSTLSMIATKPVSTLSVHVVHGLLDAVERAGFSSHPLLREVQVDPAQLKSAEARVPRSKVYELMELALDLTADPALGLHWAERLSEGTFVPVSHLFAHSATLRDGFATLAQFYRLISDEDDYQLDEQHDKVTLHAASLSGASPRIQRFAAEMMIASFFRVVRQFSSRALPERVSFEHAAPTYHREYDRVFEGAVLFAQPCTALVFDRALMDAPARHKDDDVHEALHALAERRLSRLTRNTAYVTRVREILFRERAPHRTDMRGVADALGLSVRSLRRRLSNEGTSYEKIAREFAVQVARRLLRDEQRTIQETAHDMGFSDITAFYRAFKRWTGTTPGAFRLT